MLTVGCDTSISSDVEPRRVVDPPRDAELLLRGGFVHPLRRLRDHRLLRGRDRTRLVGEALDGRRVPVRAAPACASAWTRCHAGLSRRASLARVDVLVGPRPQSSPLDVSSHSMTPLAPRADRDHAVASCDAERHEDAGAPGQRLRDVRPADDLRRKCGEPISSSPSATRTRLTGELHARPRERRGGAARNADSGPFWLTAPRPIDDLAEPGLSTIAASKGGERPLRGIDLLDVVHEVDADGSGAPASSVAKTPGWPSVGTRHRALEAGVGQHPDEQLAPSFMPRFSAAIEGWRTQAWRPRTASAYALVDLGVDAREVRRGVAPLEPEGSASDAAAAPTPCTKSTAIHSVSSNPPPLAGQRPNGA